MTLQIHELGSLFEEVQLSNILGDGKTFPDCIPKRPLDEINQEYLASRNSPAFDLKLFVRANFASPKEYANNYRSDTKKTAQEHIKELWDVLTRKPERENSSLITLPYPYVVPGGRFREIYYWDSYFTMLGLRASGRVDLTQNMIDNFAFLIDQYGYIPNGNRTYFLGRSQPPFFSLMVKLLSDELNDGDVLTKYLPHLQKEYEFWMRGKGNLTKSRNSQSRVVLLLDGSILNRYWDENDTPRPESYKEDIELAQRSKQKPEVLFRHLRAAAESGWDFSSRWFRDERSFETIHTTDILPVDLNCLLFHLEKTLSEAYSKTNSAESTKYLVLADKRREAIKKYFWSINHNFFVDFDFVEQKQKQSLTSAAAFPLFFEIATQEQANSVRLTLEKKFFKPGGLVTTLDESGQQWDSPNGWAPLQWITYRGLLNYGLDQLAQQLKDNWTSTNVHVYRKTGKLTEKYNVAQPMSEGGGGEYPNQDGFGWTNGVLLAMLS
jgi:alpha,alpha-trehalase